MRRWLFKLLRWHGDAKALARGRYGQRVVRRRAHRALARVMRRRGL